MIRLPHWAAFALPVVSSLVFAATYTGCSSDPTAQPTPTDTGTRLIVWDTGSPPDDTGSSDTTGSDTGSSDDTSSDSGTLPGDTADETGIAVDTGSATDAPDSSDSPDSVVVVCSDGDACVTEGAKCTDAALKTCTCTMLQWACI